MIERLGVRIPAGAAGEFSSPELTLCADFDSVSVPPPCYRNGTTRGGLTIPLSRHSVGTCPETSSHATCQGTLIWPQSSRLAEPLWTDPALKGGISVRELISTQKKKKKRRRQGMNGRTFSQNPHKGRRKPTCKCMPMFSWGRGVSVYSECDIIYSIQWYKMMTNVVNVTSR